MIYLISIIVIIAILLGVYYMNIGISKVQLEELTHRQQINEHSNRDLDEWEYYLGKLFGKPFGTKKLIDKYGEPFEDFMRANHPNHDSRIFAKYKKYKQKKSS
ncbi:hypothetical protein CR203_11520 [Salipaludibacillus neizhouensis]|uniref:Uncharacterized protein n=1 Tax=Salipaludibacillus neizhouensis TaxID=885475 RepID=A0A3A9K1Y1_9BACI|nr:hypothetical protein [Salipaludibacillus neizhouensis]RKL67134.1 hypothetical protein CR203_11520 [Salipaludibacillus neizhouensis]